MKSEEKTKMQKVVSTLINLSEIIPEFDVNKNGIETTQEFLNYISSEITVQTLSLIEILYPEVKGEE